MPLFLEATFLQKIAVAIHFDLAFQIAIAFQIPFLVKATNSYNRQ